MVLKEELNNLIFTIFRFFTFYLVSITGKRLNLIIFYNIERQI